MITLALCTVLCAGCKPSQSQSVKADAGEELGLQIRVLNYTDIPLGVVYVNGVWAGNMSSHAGGTSIAGSIGLPRKWLPGLTVEVEWQDDLLYAKDRDGLYKIQLPVEPYGEAHPAVLWLAFFPGGQIKAIASGYGPGNPNFPADWKFPMDVCMTDTACATKFYPERRPGPPKERGNG
ncbi:DUF3304 domain-containing protein [Ralstonia syzygii]|uniref:DUF3304 domain-containing protein n=1 Tax=Ralstonia syzygii TaxID=28097 RepID=UPI00351808C5